MGGIEPAGHADHQRLGAAGIEPLGQRLDLDVIGFVAVGIAPGGIVGNEGKAVNGASQPPVADFGTVHETDPAEALLGMAVERLGEIVSRKETLALRVKALDESRKMLARRMGTFFNIPNGEVTISALCAVAPAAMATRLRAAGDRLRATVEECQAINQANARAATSGMNLIKGAIEYLIEEADPEGSLYQNKQTNGYGPARRPSGAPRLGSTFISRQA